MSVKFNYISGNDPSFRSVTRTTSSSYTLLGTRSTLLGLSSYSSQTGYLLCRCHDWPIPSPLLCLFYHKPLLAHDWLMNYNILISQYAGHLYTVLSLQMSGCQCSFITDNQTSSQKPLNKVFYQKHDDHNYSVGALKLAKSGSLGRYLGQVLKMLWLSNPTQFNVYSSNSSRLLYQ